MKSKESEWSNHCAPLLAIQSSTSPINKWRNIGPQLGSSRCGAAPLAVCNTLRTLCASSLLFALPAAHLAPAMSVALSPGWRVGVALNDRPQALSQSVDPSE